MSRVKDKTLVQDGRRSLEWTCDKMPILAKIWERFKKEKPLAGIAVGVAMHVEQKTGILLKTLQSAGAEVSAASCNPLTTDDAVAVALAEEMDVFAWSGQRRMRSTTNASGRFFSCRFRGILWRARFGGSVTVA